MIPVVFDCSVIVAAVGWRSEPYQCLVSVAQRRTKAFVTDGILEEYHRIIQELEAEKTFPRSPWPTLNWFLSACHKISPAPLGKQRSRDFNDDPYLACALAAKAQFIISRDPHLLEMKKPFGISMVTPRQLLSELA